MKINCIISKRRFDDGHSYTDFISRIKSAASNSLDLLGRAGVPTALFALGLSLGQVRQKLLQSNQNLILILVGLKNIIHPLVAWAIGFYIFDLSTMWLGALVVVSAMPTAMNNFFSRRSIIVLYQKLVR